jgi:hypothetical protein
VPVGSLTVEFVASIAKYVEDLGKSAAITEQTAKRIERSLNDAFASIKSHAVGLAAALGAGFSIKGIEEMISGALEAEAALDRIGARAGVSGSEISKLSLTARLAHVDLSDLADMAAKLSKALLSSQDSGSKQQAVFQALGFTSKDTARLLADPVNALQEVSKALNALPEGGTKSAAAMLLFGRAGAAASAAMAELAKQGALVASRTDDQVKAAKEYEERLIQMAVRSDNLKTALGNALLPTLNDVVDAITKLTVGGGGAKDIIDGLAKDGSINQWARDAAIAVAILAESLIFVGKNIRLVGNDAELLVTDLRIATAGAKGLANTVADPTLSHDETNAQINELRTLLARRRALIADEGRLEASVWENNTRISDSLRAQFAKSDAERLNPTGTGIVNPGGSADAIQRRADAAKAREKAVQDAVRDSNAKGAGAGGASDVFKKELDNQIAALNASIDQEKQILSARDDYLSAYYGHGDISIQEFYQKRNEAIAEGLAYQEHAFDAEIIDVQNYVARRLAELKKLQATGAINPAQAAKDGAAAQEEATKRLIDISARRGKAEEAAAKDSVKSWFDQRNAAEEYAKSLDDISAQLLTLQGHSAEATKLRFDDQNEALRRRLSSTIASPDSSAADVAAAKAAQDHLDAIERLTIAQARYNDLQTESTRITDRLGIAQSYVDLQQQTGSVGELAALGQKSQLARDYIGLLTAQVEKEKALAEASGDPDLIIKAQKAELALKQLGATTDLVAQKIDGIGTDAFTTFLDDVVSRTKTAKDAFNDFAKSVTTNISHLINEDLSKSLYKSLFGEGGATGGASIGTFLSSLLGGKSAGPSASASKWVSGQDLAGGADLASTAAGSASQLASMTAMTAAVSAETVATTSSTLSITTMGTAAAAAAQALAAVAASGGGGGSGIASLFSSGGGVSGDAGWTSGFDLAGAADGMDNWKGGPLIVGERGKEIVNLPRGSQVVPNHKIGKVGGDVTNNSAITINIPQSTSRASASQIAAKSAKEVSRAVSRFGK